MSTKLNLLDSTMFFIVFSDTVTHCSTRSYWAKVWMENFRTAKSEAYLKGDDWDERFPADIRPYEAECNPYRFESAYERVWQLAAEGKIPGVPKGKIPFPPQ